MCTYVHLIPYLCLATIWEFKGAALSNCIIKKKEMKLIYSMRKRNSQISISNFKFNFNRKILKMCTSKFFHVLYIHMCVYLYIEMLMYHTYSQNSSGNISVHYFPHTYDIISLKMSIIISLKIILHLFHH